MHHSIYKNFKFPSFMCKLFCLLFILTFLCSLVLEFDFSSVEFIFYDPTTLALVKKKFNEN